MRLRLLPTLIFFAAFTLSLKLGALWTGLDGLMSSSTALAQAVKPESAKTDKGGNVTGGKTPVEARAKMAGDGTGRDAKTTKGPVTPDERLARFDPTQVTDSELNVLQQLATRRAELDKREQALDTREKLLRATEQRIETKVAELKGMQHTITALLKKHDKEKEAQLHSVVKIYEKMKPKDAARIFERLDMGILLDVVERMREDRAAPILAKMSPAKAKSVTAALALRRALPKGKNPQQN